MELDRDRPYEAFAAAALPVLLHRLRNATQSLVAVRSLVDLAGDEAWPASCGAALSSTAEEAHELGWLFGVLAGSLGSDVLLTRCEPRGIASALELARGALARNGVELAIEGPVPDLAPRRADGIGPPSWCVAAAIAAFVWHAGDGAPSGATLSLRFEGARRLRGGRVADEEGFARAAGRVLEGAPGCELAFDERGWELALPEGWLRAGP